MNGFDSYRVRERADIARWVLVGAFLVLSGAFFRTQVIQHDKFQLKAETNRLRPIPLDAAPGRDPRPARPDHRRERPRAIRSSCSRLEPGLAPRGAGPRGPLSCRSTPPRPPRSSAASPRRRYQPVVVFGDATFETVARLEEHRAVLPGLVIQSEPKRLYPAGKAVAHLVGLRLRGDRVGPQRATGFPAPGWARSWARRASSGSTTTRCGAPKGVRYIEVNARGRLVREEASTASLPPTPGQPIRTTIDLDLQRYIDSIWPAGVRGAMVAMTPDGRGPRAVFGADLRPQRVRRRDLDRASGARLNDDEARPLLNRAIQTRYPPASPFKLAIAAMALKRGLIGLDTHMPPPCRGGLRLGNRVFRCWKKEGHGSLDLIGAVAASCDVYFYQLGLRLGPRRHHPGRRADGLPGQERDRPGERGGPDLSRPRPPTSTGSTARATGARPPPRSTSRSARVRTPRP